MATCPKSALIGNISELRTFLCVLSKASALYLNIEGLNLSRHGTVSIITILVHPSNQVQLIDVLALGDLAFSTASEDGKTLQSILEDHSICKYIWDVRNDANALWFHFGVSLGGTPDLQLLENASRAEDKTYIRSLEMCIQNDLKLGFMVTSRWLRTKQDIKKFMRTDIFSVRPMDLKTMEYCQNDIIHLPALREVYIVRTKPEWLTKAKEESENRVTLARSPEYDPSSERKKLGPWGTGGQRHLITMDQMHEMMEEEREENIARDLLGYGYDDDLDNFEDDYGWNQEGPGDYEDWGALHSDWDRD
jgi:exonuclease 3'-5' domain-containing protein 1